MKKIPSIHQPIQKSDGSMEYVWYLFLQWVSENTGKVDLSDYFTKEETEALLAVKANTDDLADVAFSGSYNDLSNKPTIPTVGDGIITVKQGGVTKGTFTVNQSGDTEINIDEGGSDIDNLTITKNTDDEMQAVAVIDQNTGIVKTWTGTAAEYDAIVTKDPDTEYIITDDIGGAAIVGKEISERNIGELVYSLVPIIDSGLHLLDGDLLDGAGIYADFYDYMADIQATAPQIFCSEADWQTSISTYGACGKFVIDTVNHTIRLPKVTGFVEGTVTPSALGDLVEAGLPNITGSFSTASDKNLGTGAFSWTSTKYATNGGGQGGQWGINFSAQNSNSIYGNSTTVQPQSVKGYIYMVIANTAKTPVQVDIDNIATELNACYSHRVVEFQAPTADNGYVWYRKYADGWVEQGGVWPHPNPGTYYNSVTIALPVVMANANYSVVLSNTGTNTTAYAKTVSSKTTTEFVCTSGGDVSKYNGFDWQVSGMAA